MSAGADDLQSGTVDEPAALGIALISEHWGSLILRLALGLATVRFEEFQVGLGVPPHELDVRLGEFVRAGLLEVRRHPEVENVSVYVLTDRGRDLAPVLAALDSWKQQWAAPGAPLLLVENVGEGTTRTVDPTERPDDDHTVAVGPASVRISLLGTFSVELDGRRRGTLPKSSQRLLAYVALKDRAVGRATVAGTLWPDATEFRAAVSLRSALTRLNEVRDAIVKSSDGLSLAGSVTVDLRDAQALAQRLLQLASTPIESDLDAEAVAALSVELLPDWYDDWAVDAAQDWRQTRMNALEVQARILIDGDRLAEAAEVAQTVIRVEPLRESAHTLLVRIHLAEGNQSQALSVFEGYRKLLLDQLGLEPTELLTELVAGIRHQ